MREKVLECFNEKNRLSVKDLEKMLHLRTSKEFVSLIKCLNGLESEHFIFNNHSQYILIDQKKYYYGKIKDVSKWEYQLINGDSRIYLNKKGLIPLFDGDEIILEITKKETKILKVISRGLHLIAGTIYKRKNKWIFFSDNDYHCSFNILNPTQFCLRNNLKVVAEVEKYDNPLSIRISKIIGYEGDVGVDVTSMLYSHDVRQEFSEDVIKQAKHMPSKVSFLDDFRCDLRSLTTFTIDGDDARDFDDAISIEKVNDGYQLYVHIADVSYYVKENSPIDKEAFLRSTSIYLCDRVIPMLPFELSNGICSLNPGVDRNALTCQMHVDRKGNIKEYKIYPSLICSDERCTYSKVNRFLDGFEEYDCIKEQLNLLYECSRLLNRKSTERGVIDFNSNEIKIVLNEKGKPVRIFGKERGFSEQMIEECMISANVCVANFLHSNGYPGMYRIHEKPDPEKVQSLIHLSYLLHVPCDIDAEEPETIEIQEFLSSIENKEKKEILSSVALRCMQKARYDKDCIGHYGLSLDEYCHFTSPIRRYSDLVIHRMLYKYCFTHKNLNDISKDNSKIEKQSLQVSQKERDAIYIERLVNDYKCAEYMEDKIGHTFEGTIISVLNFGFFVELDNLIEGLVPVHSLQDDFYDYDEDLMALCARNTDKQYQIGMKVNVICTDVCKEKGQITFSIK